LSDLVSVQEHLEVYCQNEYLKKLSKCFRQSLLPQNPTQTGLVIWVEFCAGALGEITVEMITKANAMNEITQFIDVLLIHFNQFYLFIIVVFLPNVTNTNTCGK
jgi:hypothetical protein